MRCPHCNASIGFRDLMTVDLRDLTCLHCTKRIYFALSNLVMFPGVVIALFGLSRIGVLQMEYRFALPAYIFLSVALLALASLRFSSEPGALYKMNSSTLHRLKFTFSISAICLGICLLSVLYTERIPDRAGLIEKNGVVENIFLSNGVLHYLQLKNDPHKLRYLVHDRFPINGGLPKGTTVSLTVDRFPNITGESYRVWEIRSGNTVLLSYEDQRSIRRFEVIPEQLMLVKYLVIILIGYFVTSWLINKKKVSTHLAIKDERTASCTALQQWARLTETVHNNRKKFWAISIVIVVAFSWHFTHRLPDGEAIQKATEFVSKIEPGASLSWQVDNFERSGDPLPIMIISWVLHLAHEKSVSCKVNGVTQRFVSFGSDRNIATYYNNSVRDAVFQKYKFRMVGVDDTLPSGCPPALEESVARAKAIGYAQQIGIPKDFHLSQMTLDLKTHRTWSATWQRKQNGFPYYPSYENTIVIGIMAFDGELYYYEKRISGDTCPTTEVKIKKDEAIAHGWDILYRKYPHSLSRDTLKADYPIKSVELQIVQPNAVLGRIVPFWKKKSSRLAWVLTYGLKNDSHSMEEWWRVLKAHGDHDKFVVEIDAATKEFLGGDDEATYNP